MKTEVKQELEDQHEIEQAEIDGDTIKLNYSETSVEYRESENIITTNITTNRDTK